MDQCAQVIDFLLIFVMIMNQFIYTLVHYGILNIYGLLYKIKS